MSKLLSILVAVALFAATSVAHACFGGSPTCESIPGASKVDFTKVTVGSSQSELKVTSASGVGVTVTSTGGSLTASSAGLGVSGGLDSGINNGESLKITFASPVDIQQIGLTNVDTGWWWDINKDSGVITVYDVSGKIVAMSPVYDNSLYSNAMTFDLKFVFALAQSAEITGNTGSFALGSVCFKALTPPSTSVPELSTKGSMSAGLLFAGVAMAFSGRRRRQS